LSSERELSRTTAYKVHDLDPVTIGQSRLRPLAASDYFLIKLDGDARRNQRQLADEVVQR